MSGFVKGLAKLHRQFDAIEDQILKKALRSVLNKAGTPILKAAKNHCPVRPGKGHLKKALRKRFWYAQSKGRAGIAIGVSDSYSVPNPDFKIGANGKPTGGPKNFIPKNYLHLVVLGTKTAAPNDFLSRAMIQTRAEARAILDADLKPAIAKIAKKIGGPK